MGDLKPLGSEKLNGDDKLKRILELTYFNNNNKSNSSKKTELVKESKTGGVYGVVKEKDGYYVKRGLNESSLDYIGGMFMKNKNKFSSYAEAFKRLELLKGQEELQEATKYVLKQNKPQSEAPMAEPSLDLPPAPAPDASGETAPDMGGSAPTDDAATDAAIDSLSTPEGGDEAGEDEGKRSSYMAEAQKYAGKLGQELRDLHDKMESDDIKYILNMIISAVDLDKLDDEDIEEIGKKFEREEDELGGEKSSEELPAEEPTSEPSPEEDMNEYDAIGALEEFVGTPMDTDEIDLSKYSIKETNEDVVPESENQEDEIKELDLDEIKNEINKMTNEILSKHFK
jgi:hypothetical protein